MAAARAVRRAPAKVNLGLAVTGLRHDGYHELRTILLRIDLRDRLSATIAQGADTDLLAVSGDDDCLVDGNIVLRALRLLRDSVPGGDRLPGLELHLEKRTPMAAGLGGGSADGAAAVDLAADLWTIQLSHDERDRLASRLGADVTFFAGHHAVALVKGVGDLISPLPSIQGEPGLLLVTPIARLSTATVFGAYDRLGGSSPSGKVIDELAAAFRHGLDSTAFVALAARIRDANDLWPAAVSLQPSLEPLRSELEHVLDRPFLLTGSGSTLFALYPSPGQAREAGVRLVFNALSELRGARVFAAGIGIGIHQEATRIQ